MGQDMNTAVTTAEKRAEQPAYERNNDRAEHRTPKSVDLKAGHDFADDLQHQRIDDQNEEAQRYQNEGKAEQQQNGPDKGVDDSEQQGGAQQAADPSITESNNIRGHENGERSDKPPKHKVSHGSYY